jgi:hypothetical protein
MIPEFALRLICGLSTVWCVAPRRKITSGFFRIQMLIAMGLSVLFALTANQYAPVARTSAESARSWLPVSGIFLCFLAFAGSIAWTLERRRGGAMFALAILLTSLSLLFGTQSLRISGGFMEFSALAETLSCAWLLGATTAAMLLGHWYLTATGMSLDPLKQYTVLFAIAGVLRVLVVGTQSWMGHGAEGNWTLLLLRWCGLIGPLALAFLTWRILRYRNTQSATGVLYAATILVFLGEMSAALLTRSQVIHSGV